MDVDALIQQADEALEVYDFESALAVGEQLLEARYSYGYEVIARAQAGLDERPKAIATLEEAVIRGPVWPLWNLLGNYRSDEGDYAGAFAAYEQALVVDGVDASLIHLNYAVDLGRAGLHEEALARLDRVDAPEYATQRAVTRGRALNVLKRPSEALEEVRAALREEELEREDRSNLQSIAAYALLQRGDRDEALREAWASIATFPSNRDAMWVVREIQNLRSDKARPYKITIGGASFVENARGFLATYEVLADDEEDALRFIRLFEPESIRDTITIRESKAGDEHSGDPKGVYWRSGYVFYEDDDE